MTLRTYVIRRILIAIPTLIAISAITFTIIHLAPGGPFQVFLAMNPRTPGWQIELLRKRYGLDKPILVQYIIWLKMLFSGNLGFSFISGQPVKMMIGSRVINTLKLMITSEIIALITAIPLGVISAVKKNSIIDNFCRVTAFLGVSMPTFWFGLLLIYLFGLGVGPFPKLFPIFGASTIGKTFNSVWEKWADQLWHLALPALTLGLVRMAFITRLTRSSVLDVLNKDFVLTARMKGLKERVVIYKHVLRNALLPVVTTVGLSLGFLLSGAVLTETIFAWPGMGRLSVWCTFTRDYPVIMGITMVVALMVVIFNLITDISYAILDPRIRY
ncbi:ABC transporter permease [Candidatus Bathyarchaeota archaeon]|nr:ABC transporter permease [Candidatus Bathyarchaeota archaeon]